MSVTPSASPLSVSQIVRNFAPGWFAAVMGSGVLSITTLALATRWPRIEAFAWGLHYFNLLLFLVLTIPWLARWLAFPPVSYTHLDVYKRQPPAIATLHELLSVVAENDDDRRLEQTLFAQMRDDAPDLAVNVVGRIEVAVLDRFHLASKIGGQIVEVFEIGPGDDAVAGESIVLSLIHI